MCLYIGAKLGVCSSLIRSVSSISACSRNVFMGMVYQCFYSVLAAHVFAARFVYFQPGLELLRRKIKCFIPRVIVWWRSMVFSFFHEQQDLREKIVTSRCNEHCWIISDVTLARPSMLLHKINRSRITVIYCTRLKDLMYLYFFQKNGAYICL